MGDAHVLLNRQALGRLLLCTNEIQVHRAEAFGVDGRFLVSVTSPELPSGYNGVCNLIFEVSFKGDVEA